MTKPAWVGKRRDANEALIVMALERAGATVVRQHTPCDLVVGFRGENFLLEVKARGGVLTDEEAEFCETWRGQIVVVRSVEEALRVIGAIGGELGEDG